MNWFHFEKKGIFSYITQIFKSKTAIQKLFFPFKGKMKHFLAQLCQNQLGLIFRMFLKFSVFQAMWSSVFAPLNFKWAAEKVPMCVSFD